MIKVYDKNSDECIDEKYFENGVDLVSRYLSSYENNCLNPVNGIITNVERVYCVGDIHGDLMLMVVILMKTGMFEMSERDELMWKCDVSDTCVVFVGDLIHNCRTYPNVDDANDDLKIFTIMKMLDENGKVKNNRMLWVIGNHEHEELSHTTRNLVTNFTGYNDYEQFIHTYVSIKSNYSKRRDDWDIWSLWGTWLLKNSFVMLLINDILITHAGLIDDGKDGMKKTINDASYSINGLNRYLHTLHNCYFSHKRLIEDIVKTRMYNFVSFSETTVFDEVEIIHDLCVEKLINHTMEDVEEIRHLEIEDIIVVTGHNIQDIGINAMYDGKVYMIDNAMSRSFDENVKTVIKIVRKNRVQKEFVKFVSMNLNEYVMESERYEKIIMKKLNSLMLKMFRRIKKLISTIRINRHSKPSFVCFSKDGRREIYEDSKYISSYVKNTNSFRNNIFKMFWKTCFEPIMECNLSLRMRNMIVKRMKMVLKYEFEYMFTILCYDCVIKTSYNKFFYDVSEI